ncbi:MAG: hypothetical protein NTY80_03385 [candidate division SR1 bacterium]|nr:hypothetical protein [candidate division SR1 bacterium]
MFEKELIKTYLYLNDRESSGRKEGFLGTVKSSIKHILQHQLHNIIPTLDILTKETVSELESTLYHIEATSTTDFFKLRQKEKQRFISDINNKLTKINTLESQEVLKGGEEGIKNLKENITNEGIILDFLEKSKEVLKISLDQNLETRRKLESIVTKKNPIQGLSEGSKEIKSESDIFNKILHSEETRKESFEIIKNSCDFLNTLDQNITRSYNMFIAKVEGDDFHHAKEILEIWAQELKDSGLQRLYFSIKNYVHYLDDIPDAPDKEKIKAAIKKITMEAYSKKDEYLFRDKNNIAIRHLHNSQIHKFDRICYILENLVSYPKIESILASNKNNLLNTLYASQAIDKDIYNIIEEHKENLTIEEIEKIAKKLFEQIKEKSEKIFEKEEKKRKKLELKRNKGPGKIKRFLIKVVDILLLWSDKIRYTIRTLAPKSIIIAVTIILLTIFRTIQETKRRITDLIALIKGGNGENRNEKDNEESYEKGEENENNDGESRLQENKTIGRLLSRMREQSTQELLNNMFSGSLLGMSGRENDLRHESDLLNRGSDKLKNIEIRNYGNLHSNILVGEVFFRLEGTKRLKEKIDHKNKHILERNNKEMVIRDYSFFLSQNNRELRNLPDEKYYPTLILSKGSLTKGINSIVCPRGYVPVLSQKAKEIFQEQGIKFELYCIKNLGYYYLALDKVPSGDIGIHYVRYGDKNYNGIFFNTPKNQGTQGYKNIENLLTAKIVNKEELPESIQTVIDEQGGLENPESAGRHSTNFLSSKFLYSKYRDNTVDQYKKHPSYLAGVAHTGIGDCKNINTLNIALLRQQNIQAQECAGYVKSGEGYEGHGVTEANIEGKCLLLDATPHEEAPDKKKIAEAEEVKRKEERKQKIKDQFSLAKSFLAEKLEHIREWYKKTQKTGEKIEKMKKGDETLIIEKNIARAKGDLIKLLKIAEHSDNDENKRFAELLKFHIEGLISKEIWKELGKLDRTKHVYKEYILEYYKRLKNLLIVMKFGREYANKNQITPITNTITSNISKNYEHEQQFSNELNYINKKIGTDITISFINERIVYHTYTQVSDQVMSHEIAELIVSEIPEIEESENNEYKNMLTAAIVFWIAVGYSDKRLPYDVNTVVEKQLMKDITDSSYGIVLEVEEKKNIEGHKKDITPNKVKQTILSELQSTRASLEGEIYKNYNNELRSVLLARSDEIFTKFYKLDDAERIGRSKTDLESIKKEFATRKSMLTRSWIKTFPTKASYELDLIVSFVRKEELNESLTNEKIKSEDSSNITYELLSMITNKNYKSEIKKENFFELFERYLFLGNNKFANLLYYTIKRDPPHSIFAGAEYIYRTQIETELLPALEKKLLEKYKENPTATIDFVASKEKLEISDYGIIEDNLDKICKIVTESSTEKMAIEKAIFSVIETILAKKSSNVEKGNQIYKRRVEYTGIGKRHLATLLHMIKPDQKLDICKKAYNIFYEKEKAYRKMRKKSSEEHETERETEFRNTSEVLEGLLESLQEEKMENKSSFGTKLLEFRIHQLNNRMREWIYSFNEHERKQIVK